jgi:beta-mannosidase
MEQAGVSESPVQSGWARLSLNGPDWQFKGYYGEDWLWRGAHQPVTRDVRHWFRGTVPGSVQNDLWQCGQIPNPYWERNSLLIEWVPQRTWVYKKWFTIGREHLGRRVRLHCKGVDYEAQFFLNGERLGDHRGMFTPALFEIGAQLRYGEENLLAIVIEPAPPELPQVGRSERVRTHKSRMNYWWDFCPRLVHLGIWDDVSLEISGPARIEHLWVRPQLSPELDRAEVSISIELTAAAALTAELETTLRFGGQRLAGERRPVSLPQGITRLETRLALAAPQLWWPNGYGEQPLYEAEARLIVAGPVGDRTAREWLGHRNSYSAETGHGREAGSVGNRPEREGEGVELESDRRCVRFGVRRIEFTPNESASPEARPYTLRVNGRRIYIQGWNWVPLDALYGVERPEKQERLLTLAKNAHVNLLRVWGGGLIEKEGFYDLCDRLGLLVWQEFIQSSSGISNRPPEAPEMIALLAGEAEQIIPRRRNHPSLAIWCGGNELQVGPEQPADERQPLLAALREAVRRLDPDRHWLPTSPSGPLFSNSLENLAGDPSLLHDVHGPWEHQGLAGQPDLYNRGASLLHSEFGVEGITNLRSLNAVIARENQWPVSLENPLWEHLGAWWVKEARWREIFGELPDVETAVRAVQLLQADGLRYAVEADRRRQYHNSGSLPWQFNEPYPMAACTSAVDYFARPKPAYYAVAGAYAPVRVSARFARQSWENEPDFAAEIWISNARAQPYREAGLEARLVGVSGRSYHRLREAVSLGPDGSSRLLAVNWPLAGIEEPIFFLDLRLCQAGGEPLSENRYLFTRAADLAPLFSTPATALEVGAAARSDRWEVQVANAGEQTALFVWLEDDRAPDKAGGASGYAGFDQNHFCLFPGERRTVAVDWSGVPAGERRLAVGGWNTPVYRIGA